MFVMALVVSNVVAVKLVEVWGRVFDAGTLLFPLTYLIGDVLTEVYGYRRARLVIWVGFESSLLAIGAIQLAIVLPPAAFWAENEWRTNPCSTRPGVSSSARWPRTSWGSSRTRTCLRS